MRLDDVKPFRLALHVLEGFPSLELWRVVVREVKFPVLLVFIYSSFTCLVLLAVAVADREVGRVVRHGLAALDARLPVAQGEVLVFHHRLCEAAQRVTSRLVFTLVESVLKQHVSVKRIVLRRNLLP